MAELSLQDAFQVAVEHHEAGRLAEAEHVYRQILAVSPGEIEVLGKLAILAMQVGQAGAAVELLGEVIERGAGDAVVRNNLGYALQMLGCHAEALEQLSAAIALQPNYSEAYNNLGNSYAALDNYEQAIGCFLEALRLNPQANTTPGNLIAALRRAGRLDEALEAGLAAAELHPTQAEIFNNIGDVLFVRRRFEEALSAFSRALEINPNLVQAVYNGGNTLHKLGRFAEAEQAYRRATQICPTLIEAHNNLGLIQFMSGRLDEAQASFRHVLALAPDDASALLNLGNVLKDLGCVNEALDAYRVALADPAEAYKAHSNLLLTTHYQAEHDPADLFAEHCRWNERHGRPLAEARRFLNSRVPDRCLRIGYVSPDFRDHPVGRFMQPIFELHDRFEVEVFAYADLVREDEVTGVLKPLVDYWRLINGRSDEEVAEMMYNDQIDILVDLAGQTGDNRLRVFARKPAPVQVSYLGYPNTSGLDTIDYRFTDSLADPPGESDSLHTEELVRLDPSAWCLPSLPEVPVVPRATGPIVFGSCNTAAKVSDGIVRLWGYILAAVPDSELLLKAAGWINSAARQRVLGILAGYGVVGHRVRFAPRVAGYTEHFEFIRQIDIALDTFPYHGTSTTCDALWMGIPVITLAGETHVSRVGVSLLTNAGHPEWIAQSEEEYVGKATELALDPERLADVRASLRGELFGSPLMDGGALAARVEAAYRRMWKHWCATASQL